MAVRDGWWRRRGVRVSIAVVVLALFLVVGRDQLGDLRRLASASPYAAGAMAVVFLATRLIQGASDKIFLARLGYGVGLIEMFLLNMLMSYTNLVLPRVGLGTPAVYLKHRHGVSFAQFSSFSLAGVVLHVTLTGAMGLTCVALARFALTQPADIKAAAVFGLVTCAGIASYWVPVPTWRNGRGRLVDFLRRLGEAWRYLGADRALIGRVLALRSAMLILIAVRLKLSFVALDVEVTWTGVVIATALGTLALLISVTPSGLGFREAAVAYSASMLGCTPAAALSAAVLDRAVMTLCVVVVAQLGMWRLGKVHVAGAAGPANPRIQDSGR